MITDGATITRNSGVAIAFTMSAVTKCKTVNKRPYRVAISFYKYKTSKFENFNYLNVAFISYKLTTWN